MKTPISLIALIMMSSAATANEHINVNMMHLETGQPAGTVTISKSAHGIVFTPDLEGLPTGQHGFHVHQIGACGAKKVDGKLVLGGAAGSHYDPTHSNQHGLPWTHTNHRGDLPALYVDNNGEANSPVLAPRLTLAELQGKSLMIHMNGDNYSDSPKPLGGGGSRIACGVIN